MLNCNVKVNDVCRLIIEGYTADGTGVARLDGIVVFVQGGIRGEECDVRIEKVGRSNLFGRVVRVFQPSPARIMPQCIHYTKCGGCQFRHMNYAEELEAKRIRVEDCLRRIAGLDVTVPVIHGARDTRRYRNKVQFPVQPGPEGPRVGFYRQRTHQVVSVEDCLLQPETAARLRAAAVSWMQWNNISAYDETTGRGLVRHMYVRVNRAGQSLFCLLVNGKSVPQEEALVRALRNVEPGLAGVVLGVNEKKNNVILGDSYRTLWGRDALEDTLCGFTFRLSVPSFYQVNADQAEVLYGRALDFAGLTGTETVLDLYCGIGTISLVMARQAGRVFGAEVVPQAVEDARENALRNGVTSAEFLCGDAGEAARALAARGVKPDVVCVDPPRKGLAEDVVDTIAAMAPERIVYVSCDPATLARDVKRFAALGYALRKAEAVDMFPRTAHVETVVLLSKLNTKQHVEVELNLDELDLTAAESKATYEEIKAYVLEKFGLKVSSLYISQVKRKCGLDVGQNYNLPKKENAKVPQCPPEKEAAIMEALKHFQMLE